MEERQEFDAFDAEESENVRKGDRVNKLSAALNLHKL